MSDISPTEQQHTASLNVARQEGAESGARNFLKKSRAKLAAAVPPNGFIYMLVFVPAIVNDGIDWITIKFTVTGIWLVILRIIDLATAGILWTWVLFSKTGEAPSVGKKLSSGISDKVKTMGIASVVELIPFVGEIVPGWSGAVLRAYLKHRNAYHESLEQRRKQRAEGERQKYEQERAQQLASQYAQHTEAGRSLQEAVQ